MDTNNPTNNRQGGNQPKMPRFNMTWLYITIAILLAVFLLSGGGNALGSAGAQQTATYTKFKEYVSKGYAKKVIINKDKNVLRLYVKPQ